MPLWFLSTIIIISINIFPCPLNSDWPKWRIIPFCCLLSSDYIQLLCVRWLNCLSSCLVVIFSLPHTHNIPHSKASWLTNTFLFPSSETLFATNPDIIVGVIFFLKKLQQQWKQRCHSRILRRIGKTESVKCFLFFLVSFSLVSFLHSWWNGHFWVLLLNFFETECRNQIPIPSKRVFSSLWIYSKTNN